MRWLAVLATAAGVAASVLPAWSQAFPTRPITIIVNSAAGGPTDAVARVMKEVMEASLGQPIIIENRVGAIGIIGASAVAHSEPDGYTMLMSGAGPTLIVPIVNPSIDYQPLRDFQPVTLAIDAESFFVANAKVAKTLPEFIEAAKKNPGKLSFGSAGIAGPSHLASEYLKIAADIDIVHVPYRGAPQAVTDMLSGQIAMYASTLQSVRPHIEAGTLSALATIGDTRAQSLPNVKTTAEYGYPDVAIPAFFGYFVRKGVPRDIVAKLDAAAQKALADPKVRQVFAHEGYIIRGYGPDKFSEKLVTDTAKWTKIIKQANIKVQ